ncbi:MAG: methionyl-tRNA formyltransferase [Planctomycetota bacterium]
MRLLYFGSGAFGLPTLQRLYGSTEHEVVAVVSQPDRPAGRKRVSTPTPVAAWAEARGIETLKSDDVNTPGFVARVAGYGVDASVVIAFGQKLSPTLIAAMGRLAVNVHSSLLPKFRGAAPINWAMIENEPVTGVSVIGLAQRMDAGAMYATAETPIDPRETAGELHDRLAELGPDGVLRVLGDLEHDRLTPIPQDDTQATRAPKFTKADGTVSFDRPAALVRSRIHGLTPWPGCRVRWTSAATGTTETLILKRVIDHMPDEVDAEPGVVRHDLRVACCPGSVELLELQAPGGKPLPLAEFVKGRPLLPGDVFTALGA